MGKYAVHQLDGNHRDIRAGLEAVGASVDHRSPLDVVVGFRGVNYLLEIKTAKGKLRPSQIKFFAEWKGQKALVRSMQEALLAIGALHDGPLHICRQPGFDPVIHRCLACTP